MAFKKEGKFSKGKSFSRDKPRFEKSDRFEKRSFGKPSGGLELFDATCESCGKDCQLPFKPTGGKPVYCRDCFKKEGRDEGPRDAPRRSSGSSGDMADIHRKLDKIMRALRIEDEREFVPRQRR